MEITLSLITFVVGVVVGMYVVTQIERSISASVNRNKIIKNIDKLNKKKND
jgi:uncharacterized membrane-anchored protein YhcB (DUF1043 family)